MTFVSKNCIDFDIMRQTPAISNVPRLLQDLAVRIQKKQAVVGIYGLGYVGLPLALLFSKSGMRVIGFDIDAVKVRQLNEGASYIERITPKDIRCAQLQGFLATTDFAYTGAVDALIICVPTPLNRHREPDLSFITNTIDAALPYMRHGQLVSLESTTWPGTTDEVLAPRLAQYGWKPGYNCALVFSPEREDPGNSHFNAQCIPKIIGGMTPSCLQIGSALYQQAVHTMVPVSSTRVAEMTKLLENIHRSVNIGLVNEMKIVAEKMGINIHEVIDAASTKPFGFTPFKPGPGLGGHCIPVDPFYLAWKAREYGIHTRFIELAGEVNRYMPRWVVDKIADGLNDHGKSVRGSRILILGLAYKKNIDDTRESPAIEIMEMLRKKGAEISYSDPHVPVFLINRDCHLNLESVILTAEGIANYDCVVLATDHDKFDYSLLQMHATLLVDTRGRFPGGGNVVSA